MERGLLWLPLLVMFFALAWAGRREWQKIEVYRLWSRSFIKAKYDIYAVLGLGDGFLVYGKPTYQGIVQEKTLQLSLIKKVDLLYQGKIVDLSLENLSGSADLCLSLQDTGETVVIPFTEISLAAQWARDIQSIVEGKS